MTKKTMNIIIKDRAIVSNPTLSQHLFYIYTEDKKIYTADTIRLWFQLPVGSKQRVTIDDGFLAINGGSDGTITDVV